MSKNDISIAAIRRFKLKAQQCHKNLSSPVLQALAPPLTALDDGQVGQAHSLTAYFWG